MKHDKRHITLDPLYVSQASQHYDTLRPVLHLQNPACIIIAVCIQ